MILILDKKVNSTYVQSICMTFFHGAKFPQNIEENTDGMTLSVKLTENGEEITSFAEFTHNGNVFKDSNTRKFSENESQERTYKSAIGKSVFNALKEAVGMSSPWGILTGIRPSKVVSSILEKYTEEETKEILVNDYMLSDEKAELAIEVTKNEESVIKLTSDKKCSVYISIPFCPSRCAYCSFISCSGARMLSMIPQYLEKLTKDIYSTFRIIEKAGYTVSTVYIGGGTPTVLDENQLENLLSTVKSALKDEKPDEFTLEGGRPDTITDEKLRIAKKYGVTRISVNPQTLNDEVLELIGRKHTAKDFFEAYEKVKKSGIECINTDLIIGLEKDTFESFRNTLDKIIELSPDNITVHSFCVKKSARVLLENSDIYNRYDDDFIKCSEYARKKLKENGYVPYYMYRQKNTVDNLENVGYSKIGKFGLYNVFMMTDVQTIFGIGAGSTTKIISEIGQKESIKRIFSPKYPYEYLQNKNNFDERAEKILSLVLK